MTNDSPQLGEEALGFLRRNGIEWFDIQPLVDASKPLFCISAKCGKYVLKCDRRVDTRRPLLRKLCPSWGFEQEVDAYRSFAEQGSVLGFSHPRYVASDARHLLLAMIEHATPPDNEGIQEFGEAIAAAMFGLTNASKRENRSWIRAFIHRCIYSPEAIVIRRLSLLRRCMGWAVAWKALALVFRCRRSQLRLPNTYLSHNDLSSNNSLVDPRTKSVYLIDFQDMTTERRWLLTDATRYCFECPETEGRDRFAAVVDSRFMASYLCQFDSSVRAQMNLAVQLRFALLVNAVLVLDWLTTSETDSALESHCDLIKDVLLIDQRFAEWYTGFRARLDAEQEQLGCERWISTG